jgi:hypothetical protein
MLTIIVKVSDPDEDGDRTLTPMLLAIDNVTRLRKK